MRTPQDWPTWRIYADQLLDRGDVRGQLIVLEHDLATGKVPADKRLATMQKARILESAWRDRWLEGWPGTGTPQVKWRMGFVTDVSMAWSPDALALLQALRAHPTACFLAGLKLHTRHAPQVVDVLGSDVLRGLTRLDLEGSRLGDEGARLLAQSEALGELTSLGLAHNKIGPEGARALAQSSTLTALTSLDLPSNQIGDEGVVALAQSSTLGLASLNVWGNGMGPAGRAALQVLTQRGCQVTA